MKQRIREPFWMWPLIASGVWCLFALEWLWAHYVPDGFRYAVFVQSIAGAIAWAVLAWWWDRPRVERIVVWCIAYGVIWQGCVFFADYYARSGLAATLANVGLAGLFLIGLAWVVRGVESASRFYRDHRIAVAVIGPPSTVRSTGGNLDLTADGPDAVPDEPIWNPLDESAWYYGKRGQKLHQSILTIFAYALCFFLLVILFNQLGGCQEIYEMPGGGGETKPKPITVKVEKVIKEKYVINPFSVIKWDPKLEEVVLNWRESIRHEYQLGQGEGEGAGFSGGTNKGRVRFIRLEYSGGDWDQDMGLNSDLNLLLRYGQDTGHKIATKPETRTVSDLARFPKGKSPPMVYMTGQKSINLSTREIKILREYLLEKHGMLFADNGGSSQWHAQFVGLMNKVLEGEGVVPVRVPLDDIIHRVPFTLPFLPYVSPHGGKDALGWWKDGRWVAYYHPGDIGDAWADGNAGVRREIYEGCFQLGVNVIFYAHAEYNRWLVATNQNQEDPQ